MTTRVTTFQIKLVPKHGGYEARNAGKLLILNAMTTYEAPEFGLENRRG